MIDLDKMGEGAEKADGIITKLKTILKKHWGFLLLCLFGWGVYAMIIDISNDPDPVVVEEPVVTDEVETEEPKYTITKKTYDIDPSGYRKGDTIYIDYYSDGYVEKYYTDGETYVAD
jgi:hypothetical protein